MCKDEPKSAIDGERTDPLGDSTVPPLTEEREDPRAHAELICGDHVDCSTCELSENCPLQGLQS